MNNMPQRFAFFALGVVTNGALGTSAISSVPYVASLQWSFLSFGVTTFIWNILFILIQLARLRGAGVRHRH